MERFCLTDSAADSRSVGRCCSGPATYLMPSWIIATWASKIKLGLGLGCSRLKETSDAPYHSLALSIVYLILSIAASVAVAAMNLLVGSALTAVAAFLGIPGLPAIQLGGADMAAVINVMAAGASGRCAADWSLKTRLAQTRERLASRQFRFTCKRCYFGLLPVLFINQTAAALSYSPMPTS